MNSDCKKRRQGYRVKHRYAGNWLKMYDKFGQVLRIAMVINQPRCFKVCRWGTKKGQRVRDWFSLTKSVAFLGRYVGKQIVACPFIAEANKSKKSGSFAGVCHMRRSNGSKET